MAIKRSFSVTITFKDETTQTLTGEQAQNFWNMFDQYVSGSSPALGFTLYDNENHTACIYLFENIASACRTAQEETEVTLGECSDLNLCE